MPCAISCIIPTVRPIEVLSKAVESVLAQEVDTDFEVIVVNDRGNEHPLDFAQWQNDPRVKIINTNRVNRCFGRNAGASVACGKYLHFLDDDDYILSGAYAALLKRAEETGAAWTYGHLMRVDDNGNFLKDNKFYVDGDIFACLFIHMFIHLGVSLILRSTFIELGGFDPDFIPCQDSDLEYRFGKVCKFASCDIMVLVFRSDRSGATTTPWVKLRRNRFLIREKQLNSPEFIPRIFESMRCFPNEYKAMCRMVCKYYLISAVHNFKKSQCLALSRFFVFLKFLFVSFLKV